MSIDIHFSASILCCAPCAEISMTIRFLPFSCYLSTFCCAVRNWNPSLDITFTELPLSQPIFLSNDVGSFYSISRVSNANLLFAFSLLYFLAKCLNILHIFSDDYLIRAWEEPNFFLWNWISYQLLNMARLTTTQLSIFSYDSQCI